MENFKVKTYEEMINFAVKECTEGEAKLRFSKWAAYILLGKVYDKTEEQVSNDIEQGIKEKLRQEKKEKNV